MTEAFILDQRLKNDGTVLRELQLCQLILVDNANFPWIILIPKRNQVKEIIDLSLSDRDLLMKEISYVCEVMKDLFNPDKLNVALLGNIVEQLHVHIVARFKIDKAWPNAVFGQDKIAYDPVEYKNLIEKIQKKLVIIPL